MTQKQEKNKSKKGFSMRDNNMLTLSNDELTRIAELAMRLNAAELSLDSFCFSANTLQEQREIISDVLYRLSNNIEVFARYFELVSDVLRNEIRRKIDLCVAYDALISKIEYILHTSDLHCLNFVYFVGSILSLRITNTHAVALTTYSNVASVLLLILYAYPEKKEVIAEYCDVADIKRQAS